MSVSTLCSEWMSLIAAWTGMWNGMMEQKMEWDSECTQLHVTGALNLC